MKRPPRCIALLLLLFVGFLISGALALSISEGPIGDNDGLKKLPPPSLPPPPYPLSVIPGSSVSSSGRSPSGRRILCSDDDNQYDKFLVASPDGSIYFVDGSSRVPHWKFVTGSPLLHSKQIDPSIEHFIDFGDDGRLYKYSNAFGRQELNLTLEELVHEPAIIEDSNFIIGSKETTLHFLNVANGELLSRHRLPRTHKKIGVPLAEENIFASRPGAADGYIMLVRTDYSLSSIALPPDPTQISPAAAEPLWQLSRSYIRAIYIKSGQHSSMADKFALSSSCQIDIPVYLLPMASRIKGAVDEDLMLPSTSYSYYTEYLNREALMLPGYPAFPEDVSETFQHPLRGNGIQKMPDDKCLSLSSSNDMSQAAIAGYCEPGSEADKKCPNHNISNISPNFHNNRSHHMVENDCSIRKGSNEFLSGVNYANLSWIVIPSLLIILSLWLFKSRIVGSDVEKLNNLKGKQYATPKKKKVRKAGNNKNGAASSYGKVALSSTEKYGMNSRVHAQNDFLSSFKGLFSSMDAGDGRWVGKLFVSNSEIGRGSNGTVVFEGVYTGRPVAVKRLLRAHHDVAYKEIRTLMLSDQHPNIVRLYGVEEDLDFVYISLERCTCSLSDLIQFFSDSSLHPTASGNQTSKVTNETKVPLYYEKNVNKDLELWRENILPSPQLLKLMRDVVAGLSHLHKFGIVHRDMKPQNVLISSDTYLNAKLSDMGISKRLLDDMSSLSHHATGYGSSGWQAPEQLLQHRQTRAVDLFSLGCILFFCITKGRHPFGNHFERDSNIINNRVDLFLVDHLPEAVDLLSQLLEPVPNMRPSAEEVYHHPFFWDSEMRLTFLRDTSDRIELEDRESESEFLKALKNIALVAFGGKWGEKLDAVFVTDMGRYRKYKFDCTRDLLRVIRNKLNHYRELPGELQEILGPVPEGFDKYFSSRFPKLLIEVYKVVRKYCSSEDSFSKYFKNTLY